MASYEKMAVRRTRRLSDTPIPAQSGRDAKMIHSIASLIRGRSKLLLLESPDTVEVYKLDKPTGADQVYLPAITASSKASNVTLIRGSLSQSCPYLYDKRRGSFSSVGSRRPGNQPKKQSNLKELQEAKKSNVIVTMAYLGRGHSRSRPGSTQDEVKVLQQVNGGENICVFKGFVTPGEQFEFVSQRHRGYPFSGTIYVNGMMAARISSCCEYRYAPGFQQGKKSCFRLVWLAGGMPCYRCTSLRSKSNSCQQLNNGTKESLFLPLDQRPGNDPTESRLSSPLFIPAKPEKKNIKPAGKTRRQSKDTGGHSTESEDNPVAEAKSGSRPKRRKGHLTQSEDKGSAGGTKRAGGVPVIKSSVSRRPSAERVSKEGQSFNADLDQIKSAREVRPPLEGHLEVRRAARAPDALRYEEALTKQKGGAKRPVGSNGKSRDGEGLKDFYEECVEMSAALATSPNKQNWFKANILERCRLQKRLSSSPSKATGSAAELSEESDTVLPGNQDEEEKEEEQVASRDHLAEEEQDLQAQLDAMMTVLSTSDEVEHLVLRNTELTDDLLYALAGALRSSPSEVTELNLNLNHIGPYGAVILLDLLRAKPHVTGLHLFGNRLRDHGVQTLLSGLVELQEQSATAAFAQQQTTIYPPELLAMLANQPEMFAALANQPEMFAMLANQPEMFAAVANQPEMLAVLANQPEMFAALANQPEMLPNTPEMMAVLANQPELYTLANPALANPAEILANPPEILANPPPHVRSAVKVFALLELDIGGNGLSSDGLKLLAAYMKHHSCLRYLGLAQTSSADLAAWKELFDGLRGNDSLAHIILDESNLGDPGVRMLADVLRVNASLTQVDLDGNGVSDVGGNDLMGALLCRSQAPLRHLSLQDNYISEGLMSRILEEVKRT